jgi:flagellar biosynthesis/type III secretory pathway chaperone
MLEQSMGLMNSQQENSCDSIFISLIDILGKELDVYQELKRTIIYEKRILKKPSLEELNHNNAVKENIILKARMLGEARTTVLKKIARNLDLEVKKVKLTQIAEYAGPEQRKEIEEIRDNLSIVSREVNALNAANKDLLDASLGNIKSSLDFINSIIFSESIYLENGQMKSGHRNGSYLHKVG